MYHEHFGLHQAPFSLTPQSACFNQALHGSLLDSLCDAATTLPGMLLVSGPFGSGKSMLCHMLVERLTPPYLVVSTDGHEIERNGILAMVQRTLHISAPDSHAPFRQLERRLSSEKWAGRPLIFAVDDAQAMSAGSLQMINRLCSLQAHGRQAIQFIFLAEKAFLRILAAGDLKILRARISRTFELKPLNRQQVAAYLQFRLSAAGYSGATQFPEPLSAMITRASHGLLKHINLIADKAMMAAFADNQSSVSEAHVKAAIRDTHLPRTGLQPPLRLLGATLGALVVLGVGLWLLLRPGQPTSPGMAPATTAQQTAPAEAGPAAGQPGPQTKDTIGLAAGLPAFAPIPEQLGAAARTLLAASRERITDIPAGNWFLQLRAVPAANADRLELFLGNAEKVIDVRQLSLFVANGDPQQTVLVVYGNFADEQAAYAALSRLPAWIRSKGVQPRQYRALQPATSQTTLATSQPADGQPPTAH